MENKCIILILIMSLVLSSFAIDDEIQFVKDLERNLKEKLPDIDFFSEGKNYCYTKFFTCNNRKKIKTIELKNLSVDSVELPRSITILTDLESLYIYNSTVVIYWHHIFDSGLRNSLKSIEIIFDKFKTNIILDNLDLTYLHLSYNNITQGLHDVSFSKNLKYINLSHNNFYGNINIFNNIPDLEVLDLSSNYRLSSSIPQFHLNPKLSKLCLASTGLTGNMPSFSNNAGLKVLNLSGNELSGAIPDFSQNYKLIELDLSSNKLTGNIPSFNNNAELKILNLSENELSGSVPDFNKNYNLVLLDISSNNLSGNLSSFINNAELYWLYLHNNTGLSYNCPNSKYLINPGRDTKLRFCKLGEVIFTKECKVAGVLPYKCEATVISNAKSIYYINIVQVSILLIPSLFA